MKRRSLGKFICYILVNCLVVTPLNMMGQKFIKPIKKSILLSGNFGELRATHFHSGIDIRTGGMEGLPVICVKDGQLARVAVSPTGYGQALYIEHADGTTTVYGHLQRFVPVISEIVREIQYQKESFRIDENFKSYRLFFRQGDTIAYSGNTGSSGGPHLHFEIRNTQTEHTLNPLHYYRIQDTKPPLVKKIYLYAVDENGSIELIRQCPVKAVANGKYDAGRIRVPSGKIGIGVFAIDYMNDSWNKLGIYKMLLAVGKDTLFRMVVDSCAFHQARYINEVKDFDRYKKHETVYRCFGNYQHEFLCIENTNKGYITVPRDSIIPVKIALADVSGNNTFVTLKLQGNLTKKIIFPDSLLLRYDQEHLLELPGCRVKLEKGTLFHSIKKEIRVEKDSVSGNNIFVLAEKDIPLFKEAQLFVVGQFDTQAVICEVDAAGRKYPLKTCHKEDGLTAGIRSLNRYIVAEDREAPVIVFLGKFPDRTLRFKLKDSFSGIASYRGEVNGKWCLFSYDPRVDLLLCRLSEPVFKNGQVNEVKVFAEDLVGNKKEIIVKVKK